MSLVLVLAMPCSTCVALSLDGDGETGRVESCFFEDLEMLEGPGTVLGMAASTEEESDYGSQTGDAGCMEVEHDSSFHQGSVEEAPDDGTMVYPGRKEAVHDVEEWQLMESHLNVPRRSIEDGEEMDQHFEQ